MDVARNEVVTLIDDIDGESEAVDTVSFGLDGTEYEIDLNEAHIDELRGGLMPYIQAARKAGGAPARRRASAAPKRSRQDLGEVRAWLLGKGYPVKERGRVPDAWIADYEAKTPNPPQVVTESTDAGKQSKRKGSAVETPVFQAVS
jgi:hypothetical protein